ncbi:glycosyltransferase family 2 protein [uncultured Dialister sp.]|jgi:GT2 family glycosyltransferase|uniref:glycosyltransferase family 2 protein n=1 Tax=uncultured Dialister sp. TaxID=278064 RepID=UPI00263A262C|nr:glycosyltransferase family 2 protein [uncultured Dialister sp.]
MEYQNPKVYILVLNYRNAFDTLACMESIQMLQYTNFEAVILDNNSEDKSEERIRSWIAEQEDTRFHFLQTGENKGYAGGNNVGIQYALRRGDMDFVWVINNDTIIDPGALTELIKYISENPKIGICGSKMIYSWDHSRIQGYLGKMNPMLGTSSFITGLPLHSDTSNLFVIGAGMLISKDVINQIGTFCEDYFLFYEEPDLCLRAQKAGFQIGCAVKSIIYHKEGASTQGSSQKISQKSKLSDFYMVRSRILFTKKFYPKFLPTVYLGLLVTIFNRIRRRQIDRIGMICSLMLDPYQKYKGA